MYVKTRTKVLSKLFSLFHGFVWGNMPNGILAPCKSVVPLWKCWVCARKRLFLEKHLVQLPFYLKLLSFFGGSIHIMWELGSSILKLMFILASVLLAMHSIYIGQLLRPAAAPLIMCMHIRLGGVAIICDYPHPAITLANSIRSTEKFIHILFLAIHVC